MGQSDKVRVISLSRNPVLHHGQAAPWEPPRGDSSVQAISDHIERHLGHIDKVFHEVVSDHVHVDIHMVRPNALCPYYRLVTSGMSDLPMSTPEGMSYPRHLELMITLPGDWPVSHEAFAEEQWSWPVRLLSYLARFPHKHRTWLGYGHTIDHTTPPSPYALDTLLTASILLPPFDAPHAFHTLTVSEEKTIHVFSVIPLYPEEIRLKMRGGSNVLLERLVDAGVGDVINPKRLNVAL